MSVGLHNRRWYPTYLDWNRIWFSLQNFFNPAAVSFLLKWNHDPTPKSGGVVPILEISRSVSYITYIIIQTCMHVCIWMHHTYIPHSCDLLPEILAPYSRSLFFMVVTTWNLTCIGWCEYIGYTQAQAQTRPYLFLGGPQFKVGRRACCACCILVAPR